MLTFTLITGNRHKLAEWRRLLPANAQVEHRDIDLVEIQSFDTHEIVEHKLQEAYKLVQGPVVVEDVSFGLDTLHGLPGPLIKFFYQELGSDALFQVAGGEAAATATCTIGYTDGERTIIVDATIHGTAVAARGEGFGVDPGFLPAGSDKTFAEMSSAEKDAISHRHLAIDKLVARLEEL